MIDTRTRLARTLPGSLFCSLAAVVWLAQACGGGGEQTTSCGVPGVSQRCACETGAGSQTCGISGEWSACVCNPAGGNATAGSGSGSGAGSSGGTSGSGAGSSGSGSGSTAGTESNDPFLDGGMGTAGQGQAGETGMDMDAATPPQLYGVCHGNGECEQDQKCYASPFGGGVDNRGMCTKACTSGNDCPAPNAPSTSLAACSNDGQCVLICASDPTGCPTGLLCQGGVCF